MNDPFDAALFGAEAGAPNPAFSHVRAPAERRAPAVGPAGAGDIRSQRAGGAGALAVLAEAGPVDGVGAVAGAAGSAAAAPGVVGDTGGARASSAAPAVGGVGTHFVGGVPTQGLQSSQSPTGAAPAGFASASGPGLVAGSGFVGSGQILAGLGQGIPGSVPASGLGPHVFSS
jgi:hypothetical protein